MDKQGRVNRIAAGVLAVVVALVAAPSVLASPPAGQATAGACSGVTLRIVHDTDGVDRLRAVAGWCNEVDPDYADVVRSGGIFLSGPVASCSGNASQVTADVMFAPAGRSPAYQPVSVTLVASPGGATVVTMKSNDLPPHFLGGGHALHGATSTCAAAEWTLGTLTYEDPVLPS